MDGIFEISAPKLVNIQGFEPGRKIVLTSVVFDGQPLREIKRQRLSVNDIELMDGTIQTIPRIAVHVIT